MAYNERPAVISAPVAFAPLIPCFTVFWSLDVEPFVWQWGQMRFGKAFRVRANIFAL